MPDRLRELDRLLHDTGRQAHPHAHLQSDGPVREPRSSPGHRRAA
jgi:hypothetical protein